MANKMTKRDVVNMMLAEDVIKANPIYSDYLTHELELLNKKSTSKKKASEDETNVELQTVVLEVLAKIKSGTVTEIQKQDERLSALSNQKVTSLLRALRTDGQVVKNTDKKKSTFSLA